MSGKETSLKADTKVQIRDKTISKYYNKLYRKARGIIRQRENGKRVGAGNLYKLYSYKGSKHYLKYHRDLVTVDSDRKGNFLDYVYDANRKFKNDLIKKQLSRHMGKIKKYLEDCF